MRNCQIIASGETDPFFNLAVEEYLVRERRRLGMHWGLFLYRNAPSVIIGRNQNPWIECTAPRLEAAGIPVARRISGGGAVYHDLGNGNVSLVGPRKEYQPARHAEMLRQTLGRLGIEAHRDDHHSLFVDDRKVSGSAFMLTGRTALQHATLLIDADLDRLRQALAGGAPGIRTRALKSRPSPVANVGDMAPKATWPELCSLLADSFRREVGCDCPVENLARAEISRESSFVEYLARHESWEWRYGRTPESQQACSAGFTWGTVDIGLTVKHGQIVEARFNGGGERMTAGLAALGIELVGCRFDPARLQERATACRQRFSAVGAELAEVGSWLAGTLFGGGGPGGA